PIAERLGLVTAGNAAQCTGGNMNAWPRAIGVLGLFVALVITACTAAVQPAASAPAASKPAAGQSTAGGSQPFAGRTLRVGTWGGDWANGVRTSTSKLFEEQTGAKVDY